MPTRSEFACLCLSCMCLWRGERLPHQARERVTVSQYRSRRAVEQMVQSASLMPMLSRGQQMSNLEWKTQLLLRFVCSAECQPDSTTIGHQQGLPYSLSLSLCARTQVRGIIYFFFLSLPLSLNALTLPAFLLSQTLSNSRSTCKLHPQDGLRTVLGRDDSNIVRSFTSSRGADNAIGCTRSKPAHGASATTPVRDTTQHTARPRSANSIIKRQWRPSRSFTDQRKVRLVRWLGVLRYLHIGGGAGIWARLYSPSCGQCPILETASTVRSTQAQVVVHRGEATYHPVVTDALVAC